MPRLHTLRATTKRNAAGFWSRLWYISPLSRRILAVNVAALFVLVFALIYTGMYETKLIDAESHALEEKAGLIADLLASHDYYTGEASYTLTGNLVHQRLQRFINETPIRVLALGPDGRLLFDSALHRESPAMAPDARNRALRALTRRLPTHRQLPLFTAETNDATPYPPQVNGPDGSYAAMHTRAWRDADHNIVITTAAPVQDLMSRLGRVILIQPGHKIETALDNVHANILKIFLLALLVTVLLSIYLSETIVLPIQKLAHATRKARENLLSGTDVPDLSARGDEIGDLSLAFRELTLALAARIDAISHFAADVAHEIKNPLASVRSAVETMERVQNETQRQKLLHVIRHDIDRITRLISDIANASHTDSELGKATRGNTDIAQLLQNIVSTETTRLSSLGREGQLSLHIDRAQGLTAWCNADQIAQVVHNLIDNALSFIPAQGRINIHAGRDGAQTYIHVDNNGPHIPEKDIEKIFERFYSARPQAEAFGMHSGLGLSICRQIVNVHKGTITAQNMSGIDGTAAGVRFRILLPATGTT